MGKWTWTWTYTFYRTLDTETDHLSWRILCGRLVQAAKLVEEDICVNIATRDAAQVIVNILIDENDYDDESKSCY